MALQTLHFAVLLCGVSSLKYFHTADMLASHMWNGFPERGCVSLSCATVQEIHSTVCSQLADEPAGITCGVISADNIKAQTWLMDRKSLAHELRRHRSRYRYWIRSAPSLIRTSINFFNNLSNSSPSVGLDHTGQLFCTCINEPWPPMTLSPVHHCSFLGPLLIDTDPCILEHRTSAAVLEML